MKKITKKNFIELLAAGRSGFIGSYFRKNDEWILKGFSALNPDAVQHMNTRTVKNKRSNSLVFSDDCTLDFGQKGTKEYFKHEQSGITYIYQKLSIYDDFTEKTENNYIIYALL